MAVGSNSEGCLGVRWFIQRAFHFLEPVSSLAVECACLQMVGLLFSPCDLPPSEPTISYNGKKEVCVHSIQCPKMLFKRALSIIMWFSRVYVCGVWEGGEASNESKEASNEFFTKALSKSTLTFLKCNTVY